MYCDNIKVKANCARAPVCIEKSDQCFAISWAYNTTPQSQDSKDVSVELPRPEDYHSQKNTPVPMEWVLVTELGPQCKDGESTYAS